MSASVLGEIDQLRGTPHAANRSFGDIFWLAGQGDDAAVMVRVAFAIEQVDAGHFAHGRDDGIDFGEVAALGKIRNAFDEALHSSGLRTSSSG